MTDSVMTVADGALWDDNEPIGNPYGPTRLMSWQITQARAEIERLRAGIGALADSWEADAGSRKPTLGTQRALRECAAAIRALATPGAAERTYDLMPMGIAADSDGNPVARCLYGDCDEEIHAATVGDAASIWAHHVARAHPEHWTSQQ